MWEGRIISKVIFIFTNNSHVVDANLCFMYKLGQKFERILAIIMFNVCDVIIERLGLGFTLDQTQI